MAKPFNSERAKAARQKAAPRGEGKIRKMIREAVDNDTTLAVWKKLGDMAKQGNLEAIKTYMAYVIGKPKETIALTGDEEKPIFFKLDERYLKHIANGG